MSIRVSAASSTSGGGGGSGANADPLGAAADAVAVLLAEVDPFAARSSQPSRALPNGTYTLAGTDAGVLLEGLDAVNPVLVTVNTGVMAADELVLFRAYGAGGITIVQGVGMSVKSPFGLSIGATFGEVSLHFRSGVEAVLGGLVSP